MSFFDGYGNRLVVNGNKRQVADIFLQNHLISHRGKNTAPENTIPAIEEAIAAGFKHIEVDLNWTSDNVCVLLHDGNIDRTSDGTGGIRNMTYADASQYDFGSWKNEKYTGTKIPTLKEALLLAKYRNVALELDIAFKSFTDAHLQSMVNDIVSCGMVDSVDVCCYPGQAVRILPMCPDIVLNIELGNNYTPEDVFEMLKDSNCVCLSKANGAQTSTMVEEAHRLGWKTQIWTVNSATTAKENFLSGVDWIITDSLSPGDLA